MQTLTPYLWFNGRGEEAINFYTSIFKDSKVLNSSKIGENMMSGEIEINGQKLMILDTPSQFNFTEAISMFVQVETQEEVDDLWEKLSEGGEIQQCGWLKDKFGLSWQIIPTALGRLMGDPDQEKAGRVVQAMLQMKKIVIADLEKAYNQK